MAGTDKAPAPGRRRRRASRGREDILASASEVVAERGYEGTRFSDVAEHAGTSVSTLQYLFGNREDLLVQAVQSRTDAFLAEAHRRSALIEDPVGRLRWVATHLAAADGTEDSARADWLVWVEYWRAALRDDELRAASVAAYDGWRALVRDAVTAAVDAGVVDPGVDVEGIAEGVCALSDGLGIQIALEHPGLTWDRAAQVTRRWLAVLLGCPAVAD